MRVNYLLDGEWTITDLPTECPICGQLVEKNKFKTEKKHPDYKCTNRIKGADGKYECGAGFWIIQAKQPTHQLQPKQNGINESGVLIILGQIAEDLRVLRTIAENASK